MRPIQGWIITPDGKLDHVTAYRQAWTPSGHLQYQVLGGRWVPASDFCATKRKARKLAHRKIRRTVKRIAELQRTLENLKLTMAEMKP